MKKNVILNQQEWIIFGVTIRLNIQVKAIEKHYELKNILIKLNQT